MVIYTTVCDYKTTEDCCLNMKPKCSVCFHRALLTRRFKLQYVTHHTQLEQSTLKIPHFIWLVERWAIPEIIRNKIFVYWTQNTLAHPGNHHSRFLQKISKSGQIWSVLQQSKRTNISNEHPNMVMEEWT